MASARLISKQIAEFVVNSIGNGNKTLLFLLATSRAATSDISRHQWSKDDTRDCVKHTLFRHFNSQNLILGIWSCVVIFIRKNRVDLQKKWNSNNLNPAKQNYRPALAKTANWFQGLCTGRIEEKGTSKWELKRCWNLDLACNNLLQLLTSCYFSPAS